jgi:uncharacterized protein
MATEPIVIKRVLDVRGLLARKSLFLLGPRQTGKTFLIRQELQNARTYDLLDSTTYLSLSREPVRLAQELGTGVSEVIIDEVQRLPGLLNEVHRLIESRGIRFLLTGSSARKLRRGGVNLLGGRARVVRLHPLTSRELGAHFDLDRALNRGLLPSIYFSDDPRADLQAYASLYLQEEVLAEAAVRSAEAFSRFLRIAALANASVVNFTKIGSDAQVPRTTVYEYFEILRDTLVLHELPAWRASVRRKPLVSSKYYLFDIGVAGALQGRTFSPGTPEYGEAFETWLMHELVCWRDYGADQQLAHWRSNSGFEVDFVLGDHTAVEAKAKTVVSPADLRGLRALAEEKKLKRYLCVCLEARRREVDGVTVLPVQEFLAELWAGVYE